MTEVFDGMKRCRDEGTDPEDQTEQGDALFDPCPNHSDTADSFEPYPTEGEGNSVRLPKAKRPSAESSKMIDEKLKTSSDFDETLCGFLLDHGAGGLDNVFSQRLPKHALADVVAHLMYYSGDVVLPQLKSVSLVCGALKLGLYQVLLSAQAAAVKQGCDQIRPCHVAAPIAAYSSGAVAQLQSYLIARHFKDHSTKFLREDPTAFSEGNSTTLADWSQLFDGNTELAAIFHSAPAGAHRNSLKRVAERCDAMTQSEYQHYARWTERFNFRTKGSVAMLNWLGWNSQFSLNKPAFELVSLLARRLVGDITERAREIHEADDKSSGIMLEHYNKAVMTIITNVRNCTSLPSHP